METGVWRHTWGRKGVVRGAREEFLDPLTGGFH